MLKASRLPFVWLVCTLALSSLLAGCGESASAVPTSAPTKVAAAIQATAAPAATTTKPPPTATAVPKYGGTLVVALSEDLAQGHFDPHFGGTSGFTQQFDNIYETLLTHDLDTFDTIPNLVEKYEFSSDATSITLYLRKGVKWQNVAPVNGREFTSQDVKWNLERIRDAKPAMPLTTYMANIKTVDTPDNYTVRITMKQPWISVLWYLADPSLGMYPRELVEQYGDKQSKAAIGTGPFMLKSYEPKVSQVLVKNPDYWQPGLPRVDELRFVFIADASSRMTAVRTGQAHFARNLTPLEVSSLKSTNADLVFTEYLGLPFVMRFNATAKPFDDVRVRKAIHLAIDRQQLIQLAADGAGELYGHYPPTAGDYARPAADLASMPGYRQPKDADIAEAKKLLAEAGYANGLKIESPTIATIPIYQKANEIIREQMKAIGVDWQIKVMDLTALSAAIYSKPPTYQASFGSTHTRGDPDLSGQFKTTGGLNYGGWGNVELDKLLAQALGTIDHAQLVKLCRQIEDELLDEAYIAPLFTTRMSAVTRPEVKDLIVQSSVSEAWFGRAYQHAWLSTSK